MKHSPLTDKTALGYLTALQTAYEIKSRIVGYSIFCYDGNFRPYAEPCYAPTSSRLIENAYHADHFALLYQGWSGRAMEQKLGPEAKLWLEYLLDPKGPFRDILPYLYHTEPEQIMEDKGFIFRDLKHPKTPVNLAFLWVFAQATRLMYENPKRMKTFQYLVKTVPDKPMALLCALTITPTRTDTYDSPWGLCVVAHGEPLGGMGYKRAGAFLNGHVTDCGVLGVSGSCAAFGGYIQHLYGAPGSKHLVEWINQYEKERNTYVTPAKAA